MSTSFLAILARHSRPGAAGRAGPGVRLRRRTYPGTITFFTARGSRTPLGWRRYTLRPLDVHEFDIKPVAGLPDAHLALMQEENVALYAGRLRSLLD